MIAIQKKIVIDEHGEPQEVIISWAQFCELNEALGLDLDGTEQAELREALEDSRARRREAFTPLDEL
jgi:PHD/YefM family antitoxin component YafN of YafNO toxin-antitoxin module